LSFALAQIVLTDEINRATPKTQAALLEAMEERQVTVDGVTHAMPEPFLVLATQNPIEYEGTFPLPEGQLDRFLLRIGIGYPALRDEVDMVQRQKLIHPLERLEQVISADALLQVQSSVKEVEVSPEIEEYIVNIVNATRSHGELYLGASPRGSLGLYRTAQARAAMQGRSYVIPDDVKELAVGVLSHRMILGSAARIREVDTGAIVKEILNSINVPGGEVLA
jgi:MoxR-like ATPase